MKAGRISQNVLIIGSGAREHALAWKIAQSPHLGRLYVAPGNAGTAALATNVPITSTDTPGLLKFATANAIDLVHVTPDDALAAGLVDALQTAGIQAFGPTKAAAQIEWSKAFAKDLMTTMHIPTAGYTTATDLPAAQAQLTGRRYPVVIKASGLALGKGVYICATPDQANQALHDLMANRRHGDAGRQVVIEDFLEGREVSLHAFSDGKTAVLFPPAQDHKQILDQDHGPNTGGMGTYAPLSWVTPSQLSAIKAAIIDPALAGLQAAGHPFQGLLYPGLMLAPDGQPSVLEFNARFGDPETQTYMRLLETDLLDILLACTNGTLADQPIRCSSQTAITIVMASAGYPGKIKTGQVITGLDLAAAQPDIVIFHAGTQQQGDQLLTAGGRILSVTATAPDLAAARAKAYAAVRLIHFDGMQYRTDIGARPGA
ncbi:MAG TPA: phosphoribosylamine--glycine ligase [Candidatus Saccharimonas sp.]|nr:phosphoribosylamine--glycine ligase [Candidatus Saccharimonas sp.]